MTLLASAITITLIIITIVLLAFLTKLLLSHDYFSTRKIPYEKAKSLLVSGTGSLSMPLLLWDIYKRSGKNKLYGFFMLWKPVILIKDIDLIKHVLVKNFTNFYDRGVYFHEKRDPLSGNLFALEGQTWKKLRSKLSPVFTSGRMKIMYPTIMKNANILVQYVEENLETEPLECFKLMAKYTLSNIASTAFGIESDVYKEDSEFMKMALKFNTPSFTQFLRTFLLFQLRGLADILPITLFSADITSFYLQLLKDAVSFRENNNITRNDFLQMLIQLKNKGSIDDSSGDNTSIFLTMNQLSAHAFVFILGGFDTSAVAQSWSLYELALNPDVQNRLKAEIDAIDNWTYDNIMELEYLDMVLNETLRKYPSVPFIIRKCNEDFKLPGSEVVIEKGTDTTISVYGLHRDPHLFPDPDKFDPERFSSNPTHEIKPYSYLPFGEGPRFCIGMRFAKMQAKVGIATLIKHYNVEPTEKTPIPAVLHHQTFQPMAKDGLWLKFVKRTG